jgi:hypothetical protein
VLATELGQRLYRTRSQTAEPMFGHTNTPGGWTAFTDEEGRPRALNAA